MSSETRHNSTTHGTERDLGLWPLPFRCSVQALPANGKAHNTEMLRAFATRVQHRTAGYKGQRPLPVSNGKTRHRQPLSIVVQYNAAARLRATRLTDRVRLSGSVRPALNSVS
jgi:hypothetical protein